MHARISSIFIYSRRYFLVQNA